MELGISLTHAVFRSNHVSVVNDADGLIEGNYEEVVASFDDMNLKDLLLRGIYGLGFEKPSAIQQRAIVPCCTGKKTKQLWYEMNRIIRFLSKL